MLISLILFVIVIMNCNHAVFSQTFLEFLVDKIRELNLYQIITFTRSSNECPIINESEIKFDTGIHQIIPVIMIIPNTEDAQHKSSLLPFQQRYGKETLNLIYHCFTTPADFHNEIVKTLNFAIDTSATVSRCYWLVIIFSKIQLSKDQIMTIFRYGWSKKILDFTIINMAELDKTIHYYNPFSKMYDVKALTKQALLFPDKLQNMQGYPLRSFLRPIVPYTYISRNENGTIRKISGKVYPIIEILSEYFNFTIKFVTMMKNISFMHYVTKTCANLKTGKIDILSVPLPLWFNNDHPELEIGSSFDTEEIVALVPILPSGNTDFIGPLLYNLFIGITILVSIQLASRLLKFNKSSGKIFFLCIVVVSVLYFNEIFVNVFKANLSNNEMPFDTLDDIKKSNFSIYSSGPFFDVINPSTENKKLNIQTIDENKCIECLKKKCDHIICLTGEDFAILELLENKSTMKISKYVFGSRTRAYFYSKLSPYAKKFNKIIQRIMESGIQNFWYKNNKTNTINKMNQDLIESISALKLFILIICGYCLAIFTFCIEHLYWLF